MKLAEIFEFMKKIEVVSMATVDLDQPRVRIMALIPHDEKWWCCTIASRPKMKQIRNNNRFEFCSIIRHEKSLGSVRARGKIKIIEDLDIKRDVSKAIPFFNGYWNSYDDPLFGLFRLDIEKLEVQSPYDKQFYSYELKS
jgi:uncharacterized pyridoxamine 5'-phosphate oxidase family protein